MADENRNEQQEQDELRDLAVPEEQADGVKGRQHRRVRFGFEPVDDHPRRGRCSPLGDSADATSRQKPDARRPAGALRGSPRRVLPRARARDRYPDPRHVAAAPTPRSRLVRWDPAAGRGPSTQDVTCSFRSGRTHIRCRIEGLFRGREFMTTMTLHRTGRCRILGVSMIRQGAKDPEPVTIQAANWSSAKLPGC
jgi:hypothetical protein